MSPRTSDSEPALPVRHIAAAASVAHAMSVPDAPSAEVWWFEVDRPALALGSRQHRSVGIDLTRVHTDDGAVPELVRRRSGGGAVWLEPDSQLWVDVIIVPGHAGWSDDVRRSMVWLGRRWVEALTDVGIPRASLEVHDGGVSGDRGADLVCFAALGPGEVLLDGAKLVGISQRRTRSAARSQCTVHRSWDPQRWIGAFVDVPIRAEELPPVAVLPPEIDDGALVDALARRLARTPA